MAGLFDPTSVSVASTLKQVLSKYDQFKQNIASSAKGSNDTLAMAGAGNVSGSPASTNLSPNANLSTGTGGKLSLNEQKAELEKLKVLQASPECNMQCQGLFDYSISELEPVANNTELHKNNLSKAVLASVIVAFTLNNPSSGQNEEHL